MRTSKQIEQENIVTSFQLPVELYFRMKFDAEELGYKDMSKYLRERIVWKYFHDKAMATEVEE